jgi:outer membrane protein OmpA-like peptidoglycan-associated protein
MRLLSFILVATALVIGGASGQSRTFIVFFGTGEDRLSAEAEKVVDEVAAAAKEARGSTLVVAGYGDDDQARDKDLAERRAASVVRALSAAGVPPNRIETKPGAPPAQATGIPVHKVTVSVEGR